MLLPTLLRRIVTLPWVTFKYWLADALRTEHGIVIPITNPMRLRMMCEELGGMYIKLGQILAMRFDLIPLAYATELMNLLDRARPIPNDTMFQIFAEETGRDITSVVDNLESNAIATASFAQVYKATYRGKKIVIKIQKPNLDITIRADLILFSGIAWILDMVGVLRAVSCRSIVKQLRAWTRAELDYRKEASYAESLQQRLGLYGRTNIFVPIVYHELTTRRVLVQTYLDGIALKYMLQSGTSIPSEIDRKSMTHALVRDMMCQYFIDGSFHADPHPANLFACADNKIGYVDFGIVGSAQSNPLGLLLFIKAATTLDHQGVADGFIYFIEEQLRKEIQPLLTEDAEMTATYQKMIQFIRINLAKDMEPITAAWHASTGNRSLPLSERSSAIAFLKMIRVIEKYQMKFPSDIIAFIRALLILDMVCLRCSEEFSMIEAAKSFFSTYSLNHVAQQLNDRFHLNDVPPINVLREKEKQYAARERLMHMLSVLIEKYPTLQEELTKNTL